MSPIFTKPVVLVVAAVVLLGGGYAAGRFTSPDKVRVETKTVEVKTEKVVTVVETNKILDALKAIDQQKDVHVVRVIEKRPDGTTKITETKDDKTKTESKAESHQQEVRVETKVVEKLVYRDHETIKTIERNRPSWSLALQPGFDFGSAFGGGNGYSLVPLPVKYLVIGVDLERRLIGPVSTGIWANTSGVAGVSLRLEF